MRLSSPSPTSSTFSPLLKGWAKAFFLSKALFSLNSSPSNSFASSSTASPPSVADASPVEVEAVVASLRFLLPDCLCWTILFFAALARSWAACSARNCCSFCCCFCCCPERAKERLLSYQNLSFRDRDEWERDGGCHLLLERSSLSVYLLKVSYPYWILGRRVNKERELRYNERIRFHPLWQTWDSEWESEWKKPSLLSLFALQPTWVSHSSLN